jgi:hypothetical protein
MAIFLPLIKMTSNTTEKKLHIDYSQNPCNEELSNMINCLTSNNPKNNIVCKLEYSKYIDCLKDNKIKYN